MRRVPAWTVLVTVVLIFAPIARGDVKTREKTVAKFEGFIGGLMNRAMGGNNGITSTVALKGDRMASMTDSNGQIVDLREQKVYSLDVKKKEYTVMTFEDMRRQMEQARAELAKQSQQMSQEEKEAPGQAARQVEYDVDVKETGLRKSIAGHDVREVVLTIAMHEQGRKLEESGGAVVTNTQWLAPRVPAMDEMYDFSVRMHKAVFGNEFTGIDMQQMNALSVLLPGIAQLGERMAAESRILQGTPLATTMTFETVKSAAQMAAPSQAQPAAGGGLGGALAGRLLRGRGGPPQPRTLTATITTETLSISTSASDADVAIPAGFKEKK